MSHLIPGTPAPIFSAESPVNPEFAFSSLGGRYVLLAFAPKGQDARAAMEASIARRRAQFTDEGVCLFVVLSDRADFARRRDGDGLHWFLDETGEIARLYGAGEPLWVLIDPMLRLMMTADMSRTDWLLAQLPRLPEPARHAGVEVFAPVLTVPRLLEPDLCRRLIAYYEADGGMPSGTMRQVGGRTVGVHSDFKSRRDATISDDGLRSELRARIGRRLIPEIVKAFHFEPTRIERYIVARYAADEGGYFRPHRDNTTTGTAHRKFAVSINLNDDFDGGDLRFPEFGRRTYRPPLGGAVVFSCSLLHEATPVIRGVRYATLPFLYDEAGQRVRDANLHTLETAANADTEISKQEAS